MFFHDIDLRSNLLKEGEDDMNQVKSKFNLKISASQFCEITHISQIVHHNKLNFYRKILDIWNYILIYFQVKWISVTNYFRWSRLLDKSYQICQTRPLCIVRDISGAIGGIFLLFKLGWKLYILIFSTIYGMLNNLCR
jgi:hypothetical protein